jgi:plasmid stabilization system protein ParE
VWPVRFTEPARAELIDAQDWYEAEATGLGGRFRAEIDSVVRRMAGNPRQFPPVFETLRRASAKNFPARSFSSLKPMPSWSSPAFLAAATPPLAKARVKRLWVQFPARRTNRS